MVRAATLIAALLVTGCATAPAPAPVLLSKPGGTYDVFLQDRYACISEARSTVSSGVATPRAATASSGEIVRIDFYLACMSARGYRQDAAGFAPPPGGSVTAR